MPRFNLYAGTSYAQSRPRPPKENGPAMRVRRCVKQAAFVLPVIQFFACAADPGDSPKDNVAAVMTPASSSTVSATATSSPRGSTGTYTNGLSSSATTAGGSTAS